MARNKSNTGKTLLKVLLGTIIGFGSLFLLYFLLVVFGVLLPASDPNLVNIQSYIDWAHDSFDFIVVNIVGFTLFGGLLGGAGVITFLAIKQA